MNDNPKPDLAPDYYLSNFFVLIDWVENLYSDILLSSEKLFLQGFRLAPKAAQQLLIRMAMRKGLLFRRSKLNYSEINSIEQGIDSLARHGFISVDPQVNIIELSNLLTKQELITNFFHKQNEYGSPLGVAFSDEDFANRVRKLNGLSYSASNLRGMKKTDLLNLLMEIFGERCFSWNTWVVEPNDSLIQVQVQQHVETLKLLFFGNARQDLTDFILNDLGLFRYEHYDIHPTHRIFSSREELEQYAQLVALAEDIDNDAKHDSLFDKMSGLPSAPLNDRISRRKSRVLNRVAYKLERNDCFEQALLLYRQSHLSPARERQLRIVEKLKQWDQAFSLLNAMLESPKNEEEHQVALKIATRAVKRWPCDHCQVQRLEEMLELHKARDIHSVDLIVSHDNPALTVSEGQTPSVELLARVLLDRERAPCFYVENTLWNGLFGLWLWPQIFSDVKGAFANPFQSSPLDLYDDSFATSRDGLKDAWALLDSPEFANHIFSVWNNKHGISNPFVVWQALSLELLQLALACIPTKDLKAIFKRMLFDVRANKSGFPDLIQFFPDENTYKLIEVKSPTDRVQNNQYRWLQFFSQHGIAAEVCHVKWTSCAES